MNLYLTFMLPNSTASDTILTVLSSPYGFDYIADATAKTGKWFAVVALADTVIADLKGTGLPASLNGMPLPAGLMLSGIFTSITLTSGKVIAYKRG